MSTYDDQIIFILLTREHPVNRSGPGSVNSYFDLDVLKTSKSDHHFKNQFFLKFFSFLFILLLSAHFFGISSNSISDFLLIKWVPTNYLGHSANNDDDCKMIWFRNLQTWSTVIHSLKIWTFPPLCRLKLAFFITLIIDMIFMQYFFVNATSEKRSL